MGLNSTRKVHVPADGSETFSGKIISAEWPGGMYVDLFFGGHTAPIEVINVLKAPGRDVVATHVSDIDPRVMSPAGLREIVREWIAEQEEEQDSGWYENYVANSHF